MGTKEYVYKNSLGLSLAFLGFFGVLAYACWRVKDEITSSFIEDYPAYAEYADLFHLGLTGFLGLLALFGLLLTYRAIFSAGEVILTETTLIAPPKASSSSSISIPYSDLTHTATRAFKGAESVYLKYPGGKIKLDSTMFKKNGDYEEMRDTLLDRIAQAAPATGYSAARPSVN